MEVTRTLVSVESPAGMVLHHPFWSHEPASAKLLVALPGANYGCDRPVLHYIRAMAIQLGSAILLTPTPGVMATPVAGLRAVAVIGTADPFYSSPEYQAARRREDMEWLVVDGLGHGLEVNGDWAASVAALPRILAFCDRFLKA